MCKRLPALHEYVLPADIDNLRHFRQALDWLLSASASLPRRSTLVWHVLRTVAGAEFNFLQQVDVFVEVISPIREW